MNETHIRIEIEIFNEVASSFPEKLIEICQIDLVFHYFYNFSARVLGKEDPSLLSE